MQPDLTDKQLNNEFYDYQDVKVIILWKHFSFNYSVISKIKYSLSTNTRFILYRQKKKELVQGHATWCSGSPEEKMAAKREDRKHTIKQTGPLSGNMTCCLTVPIK